MPPSLPLFSLVSLAPLLSAAPADTPPNVIIILADDLGYGDLSCYGTGKIKTPAMDKLASEGLRFTHGYAPASTCTPSRYALLTGEYPWRKQGTGILPGDAGLIIPTNTTTLPRIFKNAGYATALVGKWHLGLGDGRTPLDFNRTITPGPNELGFDESFHMAATGDRVPCVYIRNGRVENLDNADPIRVSYREKVGTMPTGRENPEKLRLRALPGEGHDNTIVNGIGRIGWMSGGTHALWDDRTLGDTFNARALDFIRANKKRPFFLLYAAHEPHAPRDPHPRFIGKSGLGPRADAILHLDEQVGKLMQTLADEKLDSNTLVILTSDNGPAVLDGYADLAFETEKNGGHHANGPLRGGKYGDYEGAVRVPFLARWPKRIRAGRITDAVGTLADLPATAAALTRQSLSPTDAQDSFDLAPILFSEAAAENTSPRFFGNPTKTGGPAAIRKGRWKLILSPRPGAHAHRNPPNGLPPETDGNPKLFDLANDPGESVNLSEQHPELVSELMNDAKNSRSAGATRPGAVAPSR